MTDPISRLFLITPILADPQPFLPALTAALEAREVSVLLARLEPSDERTLVNRIKTLTALAESREAALVVAARDVADLPTLAIRGGAEGLHVERGADLRRLRDALKGERSLGIGRLRTKHEAMEAGEAGVDYLLFGESRPDGSLPPLDQVEERAAWWAEIFETPCAAFAPTLADVPLMAATGADFVALGEAVWTHEGGPGAAIAAARRGLNLPDEARS